MGTIDAGALAKAMDRANVTPVQLAAATGKSLSYICDIRKGRRTLARNPELRSAIASALDCPVHWIETQGTAA